MYYGIEGTCLFPQCRKVGIQDAKVSEEKQYLLLLSKSNDLCNNDIM